MDLKLTKQIIRMSRYLLYGIFTQALFASMLLANNGSAQKKSIHDIYIDISSNNLKSAIRKIENSTEFVFTYNLAYTDVEKQVSIEKGKKSLAEILTIMAKGTGYKFSRINNNIHITELEGAKELPVIYEEITLQQLITGKVTSSDGGEALPGVSILIVGTSTGTTTDMDGNYSLKVSQGNVVQFSFIGYETQEIEVGSQTILNVTLATDLEQLEEVLVVGYGTTKKSDLTGSVASVKSEELTAYPAQDAVQALQGRAAGVNVQATNGQPGSEFKISIRGNTSVGADSDPLIVVDGLVGGVLPPPEDIASVEILKDASATAIYGSRGANGVIMVTTKRGKTGETQINFSASFSSQEEIGRLDMLSGDDFFDYVNSANSASVGTFDPANFTETIDWQDEIFRTGNIQNYQLSAAGGKEGLAYYISGVYFDQKGIITNSQFERVSLSATIDADVTKNLSIGMSTLLRRSTQDGVETQQGSGTGAGGNRIGVMTSAYKTEPIISILDDNGDFNRSNFDPFWENPVAVAEGFNPETVLDIVQVNLKGTYDLSGITKGLSFVSSLGTNIRNSRRGAYASSRLQLSSPGGSASIATNRNTDVLTEHYLSYNRELGKSNVALIGGYSYQSFRSESYVAGAANFINDSFEEWALQVGASPGTPQSALIESEIASFYGRANYSFDSRYLITFTGRYDGSSQFAEGNKWSFFPSAALGWNISNESFFPENDYVTNLKLRASYGLTGNRAIAPYQSFARLSNTFLSPTLPALFPSSVANEELTWETTKQLNVGLNVGVLSDRIQLEMDYYRMNTEDLLFFRSDLPLFSGFSGRFDNVGEIQNQGFEFSVNSKNLVGAFTWSTNFNISFNQSEVISLPDGEDQFISGFPGLQAGALPITNILREGEPVGALYGWEYNGVYQEGDQFISGSGFEEIAGGERFNDVNGDGTLDANDRVVLGDPNPDFIFGFTNTFTYKGFDLNIFIQGAQGNELLNITRMDLDLANGAHNGTSDLVNRWSPTNTDTDLPIVNSARLYRTSSRWVEDGSYIRLKNIALGYKLPKSVLDVLGVRSARFYVSAQNLLTITNYSGVDPEVQFNLFNSNLNLGLDYGSYPNVKTYTVGFNIGL